MPPAPGAAASPFLKTRPAPQPEERKPLQTVGSTVTRQASEYSSGPTVTFAKPKPTWLSLLPFYGILGLGGVILWWIIWGGSGDISGRVSIVKSGVVEPVANTDVLLIRADEQAEEFRKVLEAYIAAHAVNKRMAAEYERVANLGINGQLNEQEYKVVAERAMDAARRADYATHQLRSTALVKVVASAGLKVFRDALSGKEVKEPKEPKNRFRDGRTDFNGRYEFKGVPQGGYYTLLRYQLLDSDLEYYWMVPVQVSRSVQTLDLSNSNLLNRNEVGAAMVAEAPVSPPAPPETHQPKWLVEELAKEKRETQERQEMKGTWQLLQTVFKRRGSAGGSLEDALNDILKNPEQFLSQGVLASSLSREECRRVVNQTVNAARTSGDKRYDREDGVALIQSAREAADTSGWTTRPRIEESITVRVWACGNTVREGKSQ